MFRSLIILSVILLIIQCKPAVKEEAVPNLPEDFEVFFDKFHRDSLFQMDHIIFPLEGHRKTGEGQLKILVPYQWEKENWVLHKPFNDYEGSFQRSYYMMGAVIIEKISDTSGFFSMERRFAKINNEWHLIFYGLNY